MNLLRWRNSWLALFGGLVLAMPVTAQTEVDKLVTPPPAPLVSAEGAVVEAEKPSALPPADETPLVPVVPTSSFLDHSAAEGHKEPKEGAWLLDGEYLLMAVRRPAQEYAIVGSAPFWGPVGTIRNADASSNYNSGFRLGAGYRFPGEDIEVMLRYTFLHNTDGDRVTQPAGQTLFATETHPGLVVQVASAGARSSVNLNVFDVEIGKRFDISEAMTGRLFAGPRFASIDQKFLATYQGGDVTRDDVRRHLLFNGGGARAGGEVQWKFFEHLGSYFRGSGSLMTGRSRNDLSEIANTSPVVAVGEKTTNVVSNLELGLGLTYQSGGWKLSVGYEFNTWFNMVDGLDFVSDAHPAKMTHQTGNLSFDGIVFRSELAY